jgi:hypothetical protein
VAYLISLYRAVKDFVGRWQCVLGGGHSAGVHKGHDLAARLWLWLVHYSIRSDNRSGGGVSAVPASPKGPGSAHSAARLFQVSRVGMSCAAQAQRAAQALDQAPALPRDWRGGAGC